MYTMYFHSLYTVCTPCTSTLYILYVHHVLPLSIYCTSTLYILPLSIHFHSLKPFSTFPHLSPLHVQCTQHTADYPERTYHSKLSGSTFYSSKAQTSPTLTEGYLYKRGKIVKNWKLRWFIFDSEKKEVSVIWG